MPSVQALPPQCGSACVGTRRAATRQSVRKLRHAHLPPSPGLDEVEAVPPSNGKAGGRRRACPHLERRDTQRHRPVLGQVKECQALTLRAVSAQQRDAAGLDREGVCAGEGAQPVPLGSGQSGVENWELR
jgi:hypothetical protein